MSTRSTATAKSYCLRGCTKKRIWGLTFLWEDGVPWNVVLKKASVKCFLLVGFRFVHVNILAKKRESPYVQSWTKRLRKVHTWEHFFKNCVADRFFPSSPPPPGNSVVGLQKKAGSLSICRKQVWTGGGGFLYPKPLIWKYFCCVR